MGRISKFIYHINQAINYRQLPQESRRLTFYSEGKNYWSYLEPLLKEILTQTDMKICYLSSGEDDPGLSFEHPNLEKFKIDLGYVRNWLFENIETEIMVMTMPDIHQYQVKRSRHNVHYIYTQHSLVSLHMVYRPGAFDHYDTIFCSGPYHMAEMRAMEAVSDLPEKILLEHGYARLDAILDQAKSRSLKTKKENRKHILIAPSWGENGTLELGLGEGLVSILLAQDYRVTLRPHPMTLKFSRDVVDKIVTQHLTNKLFSFEDRVDGQESLHNSDIMICDWSGAALDYAFGLGKPVLFIDVPRKVNNPDYKDIGIEPFEASIRENIGAVLQIEGGKIDKHNMIKLIEGLPENIDTKVRDENIFNVGQSSQAGAKYIINMLESGSAK